MLAQGCAEPDVLARVLDGLCGGREWLIDAVSRWGGCAVIGGGFSHRPHGNSTLQEASTDRPCGPG
jgi:hypothetical protein